MNFHLFPHYGKRGHDMRMGRIWKSIKRNNPELYDWLRENKATLITIPNDRFKILQIDGEWCDIFATYDNIEAEALHKLRWDVCSCEDCQGK